MGRKKKDEYPSTDINDYAGRVKAAAPKATVKQTPPYVMLDLPYATTRQGTLIFASPGEIVTDTCTLTLEQAIQLRTALNNLAL